ncbi:MAG: alpha/beta hydrolase [Rhodanobacter sp. 68-29]|nr:alpha/beta fold hydrolase [Rhodanobacter sp.]ODU74437.1 MAG: hydrolase [Rhodanobacter sp. SCN 69-32]OJY61101.1 MAG: alpha/beta hydrolase [Rhodanobacter sp. 68-29]
MATHATPVSARLRLGALRAGFVLGGRLAPKQTADRAAQLFATPFASSRRRALAAQGDAGMRREDLQAGGETIATYVWGDPAAQPYALMAHGWSSFGLRFLPWVEGLRAQGYAVVAFDQPGHGRSSGKLCTLPEFTATLRAVGRHYGEAALAVGHSLGGAALALAQDEDWHARRLVLVAPAADMADAASRYFRLVRVGEHLRQAFYDWLLRRTGVRVEQLEVHRRLPALGLPALIVHDLEDPDVPWSEGERYARYWPGARLLSTQGLGHRRVLSEPAVIAASLAFARGEAVGVRVIGTPNLPLGVA